MLDKYHVNDKGQMAVCEATIRPCKFAPNKHFHLPSNIKSVQDIFDHLDKTRHQKYPNELSQPSQVTDTKRIWTTPSGNLHRDNAPAVIHNDGTKEWWQKGSPHREDGPAIEYADGRKEYWQKGYHLEDPYYPEIVGIDPPDCGCTDCITNKTTDWLSWKRGAKAADIEIFIHNPHFANRTGGGSQTYIDPEKSKDPAKEERIQSVLAEIDDFDYETQRWIRNKYKN